MKFITTELLANWHSVTKHRNINVLVKLLFFLLGLIVLWSVLFHAIMRMEGQEEHSLITGVYWTLTVMSTLGFGDITFEKDLGRVFSLLVLLSGTLFMLILLPVTFIKFFYEPWVNAQAAARAPTELPETEKDHVILVSYNTVTAALIRRLEKYHYQYALLVDNLDEALALHDRGIRVVMGDPGDPETYKRLRIHKAALVASMAADALNTNVAFTVRGLREDIPIITGARDLDSVDVLQLAGANHVIELGEITGSAMARRTSGNALTHVIGTFDDVCIAEATAVETPLVGKMLKDSHIREFTGCTVLGVWNRGVFSPAAPDTVISEHTVLVLAGSQQQCEQYDEFFCIYHLVTDPIVIIGGGRVGRAVGRSLAARDIDFRIVEALPERIRDKDKYVLGNAADRSVLTAAGIDKASSVVITTHDDDVNVYLSIYCRSLRPDMQIVTRSVQERTVGALTRAGVDFVVSDATMGTNIIFNLLRRSDVIMVAEGLGVFRMKMPEILVGRTIAESAIREATGCSVVAVRVDGQSIINPGPDQILEAEAEIALIGTIAAEEEFIAKIADATVPNGKRKEQENA